MKLVNPAVHPRSRIEAPLPPADAGWFPHRLTSSGELIELIRWQGGAPPEIPFLRERYLGDVERRQVSLEELRALAARARRAPCHFIFHSAFCGSTLLARALAAEGRVLALKEPEILSDLAKRFMAGDLATIAWLEPAVALLCRPTAPGETIVIKASNFANPLIERLLANCPESRALLLHARLPDYLVSVARGGQVRSGWARKLGAHFGIL